MSAELLKNYGSPLYCYQLATVRDAYAALRRALPSPSRLYYSLKANPHPRLCAQLGNCGCDAEVSSPRELSAALVAGFAVERILYNGPGKSEAEVADALTRGVRLFSIDSAQQLRRLARHAEAMQVRARVLIRVNPDARAPGVGLAMTGVPSQFGADCAEIKRNPASFAAGEALRIVGFQCYMGSNLGSIDALMQAFAAGIASCVELAACLGFEPEILDLGGGFGGAYACAGSRLDFSGLRQPLEALLDERLPRWRVGRPELAFESGRYLVAESGSLFCTVEDVKFSKGRQFVIVDAGINHLGGMSGLRRVPSVAAEVVHGADNAHFVTEGDIVGPLCSPLDYLARGVALPELRSGDVLRIPNVGAYGLSASLLGFLSRECAAEVVLNGDRVVDASRLTLTREALSEERGL